MSEKTISLLIMSPEHVLFEGPVHSLSCHNELGALDILPEHSNYMSMIEKEILVRTVNSQEVKIPIHDAVVQVLKEKVVILVDINTTLDPSLLTHSIRK